MAISTIDTHKFVRRLEQAGMPLELAEVQAEVLNEAFTVNLESLVTKDYFESRSDTRFAEQKSYIDTRFAEQNAYIDTRFAEIEARLGGKIDSNQRVFSVTQTIIIAAVILPYLERLLAL